MIKYAINSKSNSKKLSKKQIHCFLKIFDGPGSEEMQFLNLPGWSWVEQ